MHWDQATVKKIKIIYSAFETNFIDKGQVFFRKDSLILKWHKFKMVRDRKLKQVGFWQKSLEFRFPEIVPLFSNRWQHKHMKLYIAFISKDSHFWACCIPEICIKSKSDSCRVELKKKFKKSQTRKQFAIRSTKLNGQATWMMRGTPSPVALFFLPLWN